MKRNITLALLATLALSACRKENITKSVPSIPEITAQENNQSATGTTTTRNDIVYTEIDKELSYNKFTTIDADKNGKNDFYFGSVLIYHDDQSHMYLMASPVSTSGAKLLLANDKELVMNGMWAKALVANTAIDATETANTNWSLYMTKGVVLDQIDNGGGKSTLSGPWIGKTDNYLAMQILVNGMVHFGWIHLAHIVNEAKMTIVGFAYHKIPGQMIKAGQM